MDKIEVGKRIKELRKSRGLTQFQIKEAMGFKSQTAVSDYERGRVNPPLSFVLKFAEVLAMDPIQVFSYMVGGQTAQLSPIRDATFKRTARLKKLVAQLESANAKTSMITYELKRQLRKRKKKVIF